MTTLHRRVLSAVAFLALGGCASPYASAPQSECAKSGDWVPCAAVEVRGGQGHRQDVNIAAASHAAADALVTSAEGLLGADRPLISATFVDINDLEATSPVGRVLAEHFASRFVTHGYPVIEMKMRESIFIRRQQGEFILSRDLQKISSEHDAQAVIAGTYAVAKDSVYVTAKLIRATDSIVLASYDFRLPLGPDLRLLVR